LPVNGDDCAVATQRGETRTSRHDCDVMAGFGEAEGHGAADPPRTNQNDFHGSSVRIPDVPVYGISR
jgi:hypothetical protein